MHIAEEAREAANMAIYDSIISKPVRYAVRNDYTRTVSAAPESGRLSLDQQQAMSYSDDFDLSDEDEDEEPSYFIDSRGYNINAFDITEDMNIDINDTEAPATTITPLLLDLLSSPLPFDLPVVNKDLLILMAAYYGDIDRYARLRRPEPVHHEINCYVTTPCSPIGGPNNSSKTRSSTIVSIKLYPLE